MTAHPTDAWAAQQRREATPFGEGPKYLFRDNASKYGLAFARAASGARIKVLKTPVATPNANAVCERFQKSVRRECLDRLFILSQRHLYRIIQTCVSYFNQEHPHQGLDQRIPISSDSISPALYNSQPICVFLFWEDFSMCTAERHEQAKNDLWCTL